MYVFKARLPHASHRNFARLKSTNNHTYNIAHRIALLSDVFFIKSDLTPHMYRIMHIDTKPVHVIIILYVFPAQ